MTELTEAHAPGSADSTAVPTASEATAPPPIHLHMPVDVRSFSLVVMASLAALYTLHWAQSVFVPIVATNDGLIEGNESILVILRDTICNIITADTARIDIVDPLRVNAGPNQTICLGATAQLGHPGSRIWHILQIKSITCKRLTS